MIIIETREDEVTVWLDDGFGNIMHCIGTAKTRATAIRRANKFLATQLADLAEMIHTVDCRAVDDDEEARCNCTN